MAFGGGQTMGQTCNVLMMLPGSFTGPGTGTVPVPGSTRCNSSAYFRRGVCEVPSEHTRRRISPDKIQIFAASDGAVGKHFSKSR